MKHSSYLIAAVLAGALALAAPAHAQTTTQSVSLTAGWNSVWLEVDPVYDTGANAGQAKAPQDVFANAAIQVVATPKPLAGLAEFFGADPGTIGTFNQAEWEQWKRTDPTGSNNLAMTFGNRPYLIQVAAGTATFNLQVTGKARFFRPTWTPDRYNLVGFGLEGTPTFQAFFGPSGATHPVGKIFRLNAASGAWEHVVGADPMTSGRAYWVFSAGPSSYMGPVAVDFDNAITGRLNFGGPSDAVPTGTGTDVMQLDLEECLFSNLGSAAATPQLDLIATSTGTGTLDLHVVNPIDGLSYTRGNQVDSTVGAGAGAALGETIQPLKSATLTLGAKRNGTFGAGGRTNLYRLKTGASSASFWFPVTALDSDLPAAAVAAGAATPTAGLWVGEVSVSAVTSIVETDPTPRPAAGSAPIRILLHSTGSAVRLLSQVTIMQTKTADPAVAPVPVLVVDPAKIPFFEGVKERNGKRVGLRLATVAYDMPRKTDVASQSTGAGDLVDMIVAESTSPVTDWASGKNLYLTRAAVTPAAIDSYLLFRSIRPPALKEVYATSVPVSGSLGAGQTVTGTLTLDPFHRSNPFRHAYHQQHPKGPQISRAMTLTFDPSQSIAERLLGSYSETISGLTKTPLVLTGRVEFRRVSTVATLE